MIGKLIYLTQSRPNICYYVRKLSKFLSKPTITHFQLKPYIKWVYIFWVGLSCSNKTIHHKVLLLPRIAHHQLKKQEVVSCLPIFIWGKIQNSCKYDLWSPMVNLSSSKFLHSYTLNQFKFMWQPLSTINFLFYFMHYNGSIKLWNNAQLAKYYLDATSSIWSRKK